MAAQLRPAGNKLLQLFRGFFLLEQMLYRNHQLVITSTSIVSSPRLLKIFLAMRSSIMDDTRCKPQMAIILLPAYFRFRKHKNMHSRANKYNSSLLNFLSKICAMALALTTESEPLRLDADNAYPKK